MVKEIRGALLSRALQTPFSILYLLSKTWRLGCQPQNYLTRRSCWARMGYGGAGNSTVSFATTNPKDVVHYCLMARASRPSLREKKSRHHWHPNGNESAPNTFRVATGDYPIAGRVRVHGSPRAPRSNPRTQDGETGCDGQGDHYVIWYTKWGQANRFNTHSTLKNKATIT